MRLLILGGTQFLGRALVADALARGWDVTVFNRGLTGTPPEGVQSLRGDRLVRNDLSVLEASKWDAVIDTWDGVPCAVLDSARALVTSVDHYVYVSSRSVYRPPLYAGMTEDAPVVDARPDATEGWYGEHKAGGELAARAVFGDHTLIARSGLVLGPHEDAGRLPWWLNRIAAGGDVLAPGPPDLPLQYVDARDLAMWLLDSAQRKRIGTFNALSRPGHTTMRELLDTCRDVTGSTATLHWVAPEPILAAGVRPWAQLPIWVPPEHEFRPMHETDTDKAGLHCRPVCDTVADTWAWLRGGGTTSESIGIDRATEAAILSSATQAAR